MTRTDALYHVTPWASCGLPYEPDLVQDLTSVRRRSRRQIDMTVSRRSRIRVLMVGPALVAILFLSSGALASSRTSGPRRAIRVSPDGTVSSEWLTATTSRST